MKRTFIIAAIALAVSVFTLPSSAISISVGDALATLRAPLTNQLITASNANNRALVAKIKGALTALNRANPTNLTTDLGILSQVNSRLARTDAGTNIAHNISGIAEYYYFILLEGALSSSNTLNTSFPSGLKTAGNRLVAGEFLALSNAAAVFSTNATAGLRALTLANAKGKAAAKLAARAALVPPPPAAVTASVVVDGIGSVSFRSTGNHIEAVEQVSPGSFRVAAGMPVIAGLNSEARQIVFALTGLHEGLNQNVSVNGAIFSILGLRRHFIGSGDTGVATVTWNSSTKTLVGTFSFVVVDQEGSSRQAHVNSGTFSVRYISAL